MTHGACAGGDVLITGEAFSPFRIFRGLFVPEALARFGGISQGAKLAWGRLARYAGQNGECFPAMETLGVELGVTERQARRYVSELVNAGFLRRTSRFNGAGQTSNGFEFLWHAIFESKPSDESAVGRTDMSGGSRTETSAGGQTDVSGEESHSEESHFEEKNDLDYLLTNRKDHDSQSGDGPTSGCKQYPRLRELLCQYMLARPDDDKIYPTEPRVVEIIDAAGGVTEEEVMQCIRYLYNERGLKPGTRHGPRSFAWFPTVVQDYFSKRREREGISNPRGSQEWEDRTATRELKQRIFRDLADAF
jgi:hypothetical protein